MSLNIRGLPQLYKKLGAVQATRILVDPMQRAVLRVQYAITKYPTAKPTSTYKRTQTYGRKWTTRVKRVPNGVQGKVGIRLLYAPFVGSHRFQAKVHQGRWPTDARVLREETPAIERDFQQAVDRALR